MDDIVPALAQSADRLFADQFSRQEWRSASSGNWLGEQWQTIEQMGLPLVLVPEALGGLGLDMRAALALAQRLGAHAVPLPVGETMLAKAILADAGLSVETGPLTIAPPEGRQFSTKLDGNRLHLKGSAKAVPWARAATGIVIATECDGETAIALLPLNACSVQNGANLAGEWRDDLTFDIALEPTHWAGSPCDVRHVQLFGAALRTAAMSGGIERVLDMSVTYASERKQFGKPIGSFQAVQQNLAIIAGQSVVCHAAAQMAGDALKFVDRRIEGAKATQVAIAKMRAGEAASLASALAHQVHGAIGFTEEHDLHHFTKRLWSWRDEFGSDGIWAAELGRAMIAESSEPLWHTLCGVMVQ